jgi:hypothetical protein
MVFAADPTITRVFAVAGAPIIVQIPAKAGDRSSHFDVDSIVDGQPLRFNLDWNGKYGWFALDILRTHGRLRKIYPTVDELVTIRNFNEANLDNPDAQVGLIDLSGEEAAASLENIGDTHHILIVPGKVVKT